MRSAAPVLSPLAEQVSRRPKTTAERAPSDSYVQALARGLGVITSFSARAPRQTLSEVAVATGLTRAGARRALLTLQTLGFVASEGKQFFLTPQILDLGFAYLSSLPIWHLAEGVMERLSYEVDESCSIGVLDGHDVVYVLRLPTRKVMSITLGVGSRLPAYATSMGRVLFAQMSDDELLAHLERHVLRAFTAKTLTEWPALLVSVQAARRDGWAIVDQELEEGLVSMAAPIRDRSGRVIAAINISGQANRTSAEVMQARMLPKLLQASVEISQMLGAR
jgi:IclR family transcriptional regulator, pca regulon regulatory protein